MQSGPGVFDESRFVMTFLSILGLTKILCSFRLVPEGKTGKDIWLEFLERVLRKDFSKQFCFIRCRSWHLWAIEQRKYIAELPLLRTLSTICQKSCKQSFWEVMDSFVLLAYAGFGSFKNPFVTITCLSKLYFRFRRFILLLHTKKWFMWTMAATQKAKNHGGEWGLTWPLNEGYIHQFQPEPTHKSH